MNELPWEDGLLERKPESDQKDFLKTFVAFANSVRPGHTAVVLIGEMNDGSVQGVSNPDEMQKRSGDIANGFIPILYGARLSIKTQVSVASALRLNTAVTLRISPTLRGSGRARKQSKPATKCSSD